MPSYYDNRYQSQQEITEIVNYNFCKVSNSDPMTDWIPHKLDELGQNQAKLAEHLGVAPARISEIINGDRTVRSHEILKFSEFMQLSPTQALILLHDTEATYPPPEDQGDETDLGILSELTLAQIHQVHLADMKQAIGDSIDDLIEEEIIQLDHRITKDKIIALIMEHYLELRQIRRSKDQ